MRIATRSDRKVFSFIITLGVLDLDLENISPNQTAWQISEKGMNQLVLAFGKSNRAHGQK